MCLGQSIPSSYNESHNPFILQRTFRRVGDLGVELDTVDGLGLVGNTSVRGVGGGGNGVEALGQLGELVTVAHPDQHVILDAGEQLVDVTLGVEALGVQVGMTVLALGAGDDVALVQSVGDFLQTVADTENRNSKVEEGGIDVGGCRR